MQIQIQIQMQMQIDILHVSYKLNVYKVLHNLEVE